MAYLLKLIWQKSPLLLLCFFDNFDFVQSQQYNTVSYETLSIIGNTTFEMKCAPSLRVQMYVQARSQGSWAVIDL